MCMPQLGYLCPLLSRRGNRLAQKLERYNWRSVLLFQATRLFRDLWATERPALRQRDTQGRAGQRSLPHRLLHALLIHPATHVWLSVWHCADQLRCYKKRRSALVQGTHVDQVNRFTVVLGKLYLCKRPKNILVCNIVLMFVMFIDYFLYRTLLVFSCCHNTLLIFIMCLLHFFEPMNDVFKREGWKKLPVTLAAVAAQLQSCISAPAVTSPALVLYVSTLPTMTLSCWR